MRIEFEVEARENGRKRTSKMSTLAYKIELHYCEEEEVGERLWLRIDGVYYYPVVQDYGKWIEVLDIGFVLK